MHSILRLRERNGEPKVGEGRITEHWTCGDGLRAMVYDLATPGGALGGSRFRAANQATVWEFTPPVAPDAFVLPIETWRFFRDANGHVTGATPNGVRIRNVRFRRVSS